MVKMFIKILGILAIIVISGSLALAQEQAAENSSETAEHSDAMAEAEHNGAAEGTENSSSTTEAAHSESSGSTAETGHSENAAEEAHKEGTEAEHGEEVKADPMLVAYGVVATILSLAVIYFVLGKIMH